MDRGSHSLRNRLARPPSQHTFAPAAGSRAVPAHPAPWLPHGGQAPALSPLATHFTAICPQRVNTSRDSTVIVGRSILTGPPSAATRTDRWASSQAGLPPTALRRKCRPPWSHPEALSYQCERERSEGIHHNGHIDGRPFQCAHMAVCGSEEMPAVKVSITTIWEVEGRMAGLVGS